MTRTVSHAPAKIKVLAVDDDPLIRDLLSLGLPIKSELLEVECVGDGYEVLRKIKNQVPDVILTDMDMPRLNGADLAKELERLHPGIPLVIFSGWSPETAIRNVPTAFAAVSKNGSSNCLQSLADALEYASNKRVRS